MPHPTPYLAFDGTCAQAMRFYEQTLHGKLEILMTNAESPIACHIPAADGQRILHACLALPDGGRLMAGDCPHMPGTEYEGIKGVSLTLDYPTVAEAQRVFAALADGGNVTMPMQPTFWARIWGMVVDKFGTSWIINGERTPF